MNNHHVPRPHFANAVGNQRRPNVGHKDHDLVDAVLCDRSEQLLSTTLKPAQTDNRPETTSIGINRNQGGRRPANFVE